MLFVNEYLHLHIQTLCMNSISFCNFYLLLLELLATNIEKFSITNNASFHSVLTFTNILPKCLVSIFPLYSPTCSTFSTSIVNVSNLFHHLSAHQQLHNNFLYSLVVTKSNSCYQILFVQLVLVSIFVPL